MAQTSHLTRLIFHAFIIIFYRKNNLFTMGVFTAIRQLIWNLPILSSNQMSVRPCLVTLSSVHHPKGQLYNDHPYYEHL